MLAMGRWSAAGFASLSAPQVDTASGAARRASLHMPKDPVAGGKQLLRSVSFPLPHYSSTSSSLDAVLRRDNQDNRTSSTSSTQHAAPTTVSVLDLTGTWIKVGVACMYAMHAP
jgi:hypothetical protein